MKATLHIGEPLKTDIDVLALGVYSSDFSSTPLFAAIDRKLSGNLKAAVKDEAFKGKSGDRLTLTTLGKLPAKRVVLLGLGARKDVDGATWVGLGARTTRAGNHVGAKRVLLVLPDNDATTLQLVTRGAALGSYRFTAYKNKDPGRTPTVTQLQIHTGADKATATERQALATAHAIAEGVALARDLVNTPSLDLYPETFAAKATAIAEASGLTVQVLEPEQLKERGMGLLLGVGSGSARAPRLVHLSYVPEECKDAAPVVLVGKGITFDSGGLDLKSAENMLDMKIDMAGAAVVLATMQAVAKLKLKRPVHGVMALAENMPSGTAIRPGDVLKSASGRTVEINNTDAEGRLVLGDALHYATELKPSHIVDLATLTGACMVALGPHTTGLFSNNDDLAQALLSTAKHAGEDFWRLPLTDALKQQLKSDVADTKNTGQRYGGAITAALFLREFVGETPWAHLDIAGPASSDKEHGAVAKGGTGVGVATLVEWLNSPQQQPQSS